jgi:hypothetical protein
MPCHEDEGVRKQIIAAYFNNYFLGIEGCFDLFIAKNCEVFKGSFTAVPITSTVVFQSSQ